jgi:hypothetical protein
MPPWIRKSRVAERYDCVTRTVDRAAAEGRIPAPKYPFGTKIPFWDVAELDDYDRRAATAAVVKQNNAA